MPAAANTHSKWALTQKAFDRLLSCLSEDRDSAAAKYLEIRRDLIRFFEWRGCPFPEDHADETVNRVARRLSEGEEIRNPMGYFIGVARLLVLEIVKSQVKETEAINEMAESGTEAPDTSTEDARLDCLQHCLGELSSENRTLILQYYQGEKSEKIANRKKLTAQFGLSVSTLRMRALRLREKLQSCVEQCMEPSDVTNRSTLPHIAGSTPWG